MLKSCPHCHREPISVICVCRYCLTQVDPLQTWILFAVPLGALVIGMLVGFGLGSR